MDLPWVVTTMGIEALAARSVRILGPSMKRRKVLIRNNSNTNFVWLSPYEQNDAETPNIVGPSGGNGGSAGATGFPLTPRTTAEGATVILDPWHAELWAKTPAAGVNSSLSVVVWTEQEYARDDNPTAADPSPEYELPPEDVENRISEPEAYRHTINPRPSTEQVPQ